MTVKEFIDKYEIPLSEGKVDAIIRKHTEIKVKTNFLGNYVIDSSNEEKLAALFATEIEAAKEAARQAEEAAQAAARQAEEEEAFLKEEEERIARVVQDMPVTSTPSFDGYRIVEYGGYVSGDEAIELSDTSFTQGDFKKDKVNDAIKSMRFTAIDELKTAAAQIGCNAIVGLDFDYLTMDRSFPGLGNTTINRTFIILTANGTAVTIEPE